MTDLQLYDAALIEINKLEAPSMLLEDYNYLINKAVQQYTNQKYDGYEIDQQATDDLNFLRRRITLNVKSGTSVVSPGEDKFWYVDFPQDYLHILNCVVVFERQGEDTSICKDKSKSSLNVLCRRLTADQFPSVLMNAYFKPSYRNPYFFLREDERKIELRVGTSQKYKPVKVYIDYIKTPEKIHVDEDELESGDIGNELEFPDYIAYEIINEFVKLLLENAGDPRLQTNMAINQTIGMKKAANAKQ